MSDVKPIQFVVTGTGPGGIYWLSKPSSTGLRTLVPRERADEFTTVAEAQLAIDGMPRAFRLAGVSFAIELAGTTQVTRPSRDAQ